MMTFFTGPTRSPFTASALFAIGFFLMPCFAASPCHAAAYESPNIVVILVDDMGYSDIGCFGSEISTPNIDQIANQGVRMTHFYNGGMCVTTRASFMTGKWWPSALRTFNQTPLLPARLGAAGYRSALIGKWHLAGHPLDHGFDHFFGFLGGFADHFRGAKDYWLDRDVFTDFGPDYYSTDALTDRAIEFVHQSSAKNRSKTGRNGNKRNPYFLFLSYQAPHNPLQAPPAAIKRHRGKYLVGWQAIREARFERQKAMGLVPSDAELPPYPQNLPPWDSLSDEQKDLEDLRMSVYAAMVEQVDQGVGRLLQTIDEMGQTDDTLILFLSDNGTDSFSIADKPLLAMGLLPGDPGSNFQPGTGWGYAAVTPWRLYKISQHAGGVTTGAVLRWPGKTGTPGRMTSRPVHMIDLLPTLLDVAQADSPESRKKFNEIDGESFAPLIRGESWRREKPLHFQYMDNRAIRTSKWTLVEVDGSGWELFDNQSDPLETNDVSQHKPEVVKELSDNWLAWWREQKQVKNYKPASTKTGPHYRPQGDRGTGDMYVPSTMPKRLAK